MITSTTSKSVVITKWSNEPYDYITNGNYMVVVNYANLGIIDYVDEAGNKIPGSSTTVSITQLKQSQQTVRLTIKSTMLVSQNFPRYQQDTASNMPLLTNLS